MNTQDRSIISTFPKALDLLVNGQNKGIAGVNELSLRDWFAGQALAECISLAVEWPTALGGSPMPLAARLAYEAADEMLAARTGDA